MTISVNAIRSHSFSPDRLEVLVDFEAKYIGQETLKINVEDFPAILAALIRIGDELPGQVVPITTKQVEQPRSQEELQAVAAVKGDTAPRREIVMRPKTITVGADTKINHIVLLSFDFVPPTERVALGLKPESATSLAEALGKAATIASESIRPPTDKGPSTSKV